MDKLRKECNVVMLTANIDVRNYKDTIVIINDVNTMLRVTAPVDPITDSVADEVNKAYTPKYMYITSDDEIKEGDFCICVKDTQDLLYGYMFKYNGEHRIDNKGCSKVIASTDPNLNLPRPSSGFINRFIADYNEGIIITNIMVEYDTKGTPKLSKDSKLVITPVKSMWNKVELKQLLWECYTRDITAMTIDGIKNDILSEFKDWLTSKSLNI